MDYERFITLKEAARTFNLTEAEMRRAAASGSLRFIGKARIAPVHHGWRSTSVEKASGPPTLPGPQVGYQRQIALHPHRLP